MRNKKSEGFLTDNFGWLVVAVIGLLVALYFVLRSQTGFSLYTTMLSAFKYG